jgi:hypothetical protein
VTGRASLAQLVSFLKDFYEAGLLHQERTISIQRPQTLVAQQQRTDLDINLSIEALCLTGADSRKLLLPSNDMRMLAVATSAAWRQGPIGLAFVPDAIGPRGPLGPGKLALTEDGERVYADIAKKDIFTGRNPGRPPGEYVEPARFYKLTDITESLGDGGRKTRYANMIDQYNNRKLRLQTETDSGYSDLSVKDESYTEVFHAKVAKINDQDVILMGNDNYYRLRVGGSVLDALKKALTKEEVTLEGLVKSTKVAAGDAEDEEKNK